jgi:hypothetical protein
LVPLILAKEQRMLPESFTTHKLEWFGGGYLSEEAHQTNPAPSVAVQTYACGLKPVACW